MLNTKWVAVAALALLVAGTGCMNDSVTGPSEIAPALGGPNNGGGSINDDARIRLRIDLEPTANTPEGLEGGARYRDRPARVDEGRLRMEVGGFLLTDFPDAVEGEEPGTFIAVLENDLRFRLRRNGMNLVNVRVNEIAFAESEEEPGVFVGAIGIDLREEDEFVPNVRSGDVVIINQTGGGGRWFRGTF